MLEVEVSNLEYPSSSSGTPPMFTASSWIGILSPNGRGESTPPTPRLEQLDALREDSVGAWLKFQA